MQWWEVSEACVRSQGATLLLAISFAKYLMPKQRPTENVMRERVRSMFKLIAMDPRINDFHDLGHLKLALAILPFALPLSSE